MIICIYIYWFNNTNIKYNIINIKISKIDILKYQRLIDLVCNSC